MPNYINTSDLVQGQQADADDVKVPLEALDEVVHDIAIGDEQIAPQITVAEFAAQTSPAATSQVQVYAKSDGKLYAKAPDGSEYDLTAVGGSGSGSGVVEEISSGSLASTNQLVVTATQVAGYANIRIRVWGALDQSTSVDYFRMTLLDPSDVSIASYRPGVAGSIKKLWWGELRDGGSSNYFEVFIPNWRSGSGSWQLETLIIARRQEREFRQYTGYALDRVRLELETDNFSASSRYSVIGEPTP